MPLKWLESVSGEKKRIMDPRSGFRADQQMGEGLHEGSCRAGEKQERTSGVLAGTGGNRP